MRSFSMCRAHSCVYSHAYSFLSDSYRIFSIRMTHHLWLCTFESCSMMKQSKKHKFLWPHYFKDYECHDKDKSKNILQKNIHPIKFRATLKLGRAEKVDARAIFTCLAKSCSNIKYEHMPLSLKIGMPETCWMRSTFSE